MKVEKGKNQRDRECSTIEMEHDNIEITEELIHEEPVRIAWRPIDEIKRQTELDELKKVLFRYAIPYSPGVYDPLLGATEWGN